MGTQDELIVIVDKNNGEVGFAGRRVMRRFNLPHRATYILVFNSKGEIFVQKRTPTKDIYPGYFCVATGGVVAAGETYEESAVRELAEELGVKNVPLTPLFDFYHQDLGSEATCTGHDSLNALRVPQISERGLGAGLVLHEQVDDKGEAVPCERFGNKVWGRAFSCIWDGAISLQAEEVEAGSFMTVEAALALTERKPFTPDGLYVLQRFLAEKA